MGKDVCINNFIIIGTHVRRNILQVGPTNSEVEKDPNFVQKKVIQMHIWYTCNIINPSIVLNDTRIYLILK